MRRATPVVILLLALAFMAPAQSDCGNCWVVGGGCDPNSNCGYTTDGGRCLECIQYVDCDNHDCAYNTGFYCDCSGTGGFTNAACLQKHALAVAKVTLIKQQRINSYEMKWRENANHTLFGFRIAFLR